MSYTGFRPVPGPTAAGAQGCATCGTTTSLTPAPVQVNYLENLSEAVNADDVLYRYFRGDPQKMIGYAHLEGILSSEEKKAGAVPMEVAHRILKHIQAAPIIEAEPAQNSAMIGEHAMEWIRDASPEEIARLVAKKDLKDALKSLAIPFGPATVELTLASALKAELQRRYPK